MQGTIQHPFDGRSLWHQVRPALFLDRDGTILRDAAYDSLDQGVELLDGVGPALRRFRDHGFRLVVVTNQSGIAAGRYTHADVARIHTLLTARLAADGALVDGFFLCDHAPEDGCTCRKPRPGLIEAAVRSLRIRRAGSWMVGDRRSDLEAGREAGLGTVLVRTGMGAQTETEAADLADLVVDDLPALARALLDAEKEVSR